MSPIFHNPILDSGCSYCNGARCRCPVFVCISPCCVLSAFGMRGHGRMPRPDEARIGPVFQPVNRRSGVIPSPHTIHTAPHAIVTGSEGLVRDFGTDFSICQGRSGESPPPLIDPLSRKIDIQTQPNRDYMRLFLHWRFINYTGLRLAPSPFAMEQANEPYRDLRRNRRHRLHRPGGRPFFL